MESFNYVVHVQYDGRFKKLCGGALLIIAAAFNVMKSAQSPSFVLSLLLCLVLQGCARTTNIPHNREVRQSFVRWNLRAETSISAESGCSQALALAAQKPNALALLMKTSPAPDPHRLIGQWKGINKGIGAALVNVTQDIKVFENVGGCLHGHNISIHQVPIDRLDCDGWRPKVDAKTGEVETTGNFIVFQNPCGGPLELNYTVAENEWSDPSKILIDDLVMIEEDLLLGRAQAKIGLVKIPVAYFVLYRTCDTPVSP